MLWLLLLVALIIIFSYILLKRPHRYWIKMGVKQGNPVFLFGDHWGPVAQTQSMAELVEMVYSISPDSRYCGMYQFLEPTLVLRDPDLIKQITVKDFDHFLNHRTFIPEDCDPLLGKILFSLKNHKWRDMRCTMSPAFTTSKMKYMFSLMLESGEQFAQHFLKQNEEVITAEMRDIFTRCTNDVIANTVFGIKCDSLGERHNEFYMMVKKATDFNSIWKKMKFFGYFLFPQLYKMFNITLFSKSVNDFFIHLVQDNISSREKHQIIRPDMINLLLEARKSGFKHEETEPVHDTGFATVEESDFTKNSTDGEKHEITDMDITAQAIIFFFGGFDSVSSLMCFMSYELGINPDVQETLIREIDEVAEKCCGKLTYEALIGMKYMDMVVSETLRLWPPIVTGDRVCTKPYTIEPKTSDEEALYLKENDVVWVPIYALHRDPKYFRNPNRFDPERFSDENKHRIAPYTYLPFGAGPRNCIGSRFVMIEAKVLFFHMLSHFEIVPVEKTQVPLRLTRKSFNMTAENGFWFGLKRRAK